MSLQAAGGKCCAGPKNLEPHAKTSFGYLCKIMFCRESAAQILGTVQHLHEHAESFVLSLNCVLGSRTVGDSTVLFGHEHAKNAVLSLTCKLWKPRVQHCASRI